MHGQVDSSTFASREESGGWRMYGRFWRGARQRSRRLSTMEIFDVTRGDEVETVVGSPKGLSGLTRPQTDSISARGVGEDVYEDGKCLR